MSLTNLKKSLNFLPFSSATGDEGRVRRNTNDNPVNQINTAFDQNQAQVQLDGWSSKVSSLYNFGLQNSSLYDRLKDTSPVPVHENHPLSKIMGPGFYHPTEKYIGLDDKKSPGILAHELGHADIENDPILKYTQTIPLRMANNFSPGIGAAAGFWLRGSPKARLLKALGLGLGLSAPTLASEGAATYKGYNKLKDHGATPEELTQYKKDMVGPSLSYAMFPLFTGLAGYATSKMAGYKLDGRITFRDFDISIETDKGSYRHWYDANTGKNGKTLMKYPYGYIRRTIGMDGDHIDVFIGPNEGAANVYVITTNKAPNFERVDEQKCMLGFSSADEAKKVFLDHYTDPKFFNSIKTLSYEDFKTKALATLDGGARKIAFDKLIGTGPGPFRDQTPGNYLGFPASQLAGLRSIVGDSMTPQDKINNQFRFHDMDMNTRVMEGNSSAFTESPGV